MAYVAPSAESDAILKRTVTYEATTIAKRFSEASANPGKDVLSEAAI